MGKLILYFTLGFPDNNVLLSSIDRIEKGSVEYMEFGFPSQNPKYDGPVIRKTHAAALRNHNKEAYSQIFRKALEKASKIYSLSYYSDVRSEIGNFIEYLKEENFSGIILPDLLIDYFQESEGVIGVIQEAGLEFIPFFNPSTPDKIITEIGGMTRSWIYYGLQPSTGIAVPYDLDEVAGRIKSLLPGREINFGFGIRGSDQISELVKRGADGVAIGSILVEMLENGDREQLADFIGEAQVILDE